MITDRAELLAKAERIAEGLRRSGWPDAHVAPEYCIAGSIGIDKFYTETISIYAGERKFTVSNWGAFKKRFWG